MTDPVDCDAQIPQVWLNSAVPMITPEWVQAVSSAIVALLGLGIVVRWWLLRRVLRGSAAAIIALLGDESLDTVMAPIGTLNHGRLSRRSESVYIVVGSERYVLCKRDLDRLREQGYVIKTERGPHRLSRLGQMLLARPDNNRPLAKGIARARRRDLPNCVGGFWLRCRCATYRYRLGGREAPLPFFVGEILCARADRKLSRARDRD